MISSKARDPFIGCAHAPLSLAIVLVAIASLAIVLLTGASGCGASPAAVAGDAGGIVDTGRPPITDARQAATSGRYIPLVVGSVWTWQASDTLSGLRGTTGSTVEALETMTGSKAGVSAYRVRSTTLTGSTINWQQDTGTSTIRHREQFLDTSGMLTSDHYFSPGKLRLDESAAHTTLGARWTENYSDQATSAAAVSVAWTVEAVDEMVTVPAGTFKCLRVHAVETGGAAYDSTFWFARNIGKVKETGTEVRDLTGYKIP